MPLLLNELDSCLEKNQVQFILILDNINQEKAFEFVKSRGYKIDVRFLRYLHDELEKIEICLVLVDEKNVGIERFEDLEKEWSLFSDSFGSQNLCLVLGD